MKELIFGLIALVLASIVSLFMWTAGTIYTICYGIWSARRAKKGSRWTALFRYCWRVFDGWCAAVGHLLLQAGYAMDLTWNVNGEIIEDAVTTDEKTMFGEKNITVSASIGYEIEKGKLVRFGKALSCVLNIVFNQRQHALAAWKYWNAKKKIETELFTPLKSK